jgi:outer membrane lipoprotein-sorting protein
MNSGPLESLLMAKRGFFTSVCCKSAGGFAFRSLSELQVRQAPRVGLLLVCLLAAGKGGAAAPSPPLSPSFSISELMKLLGSVESAKARFVETRHSALLKSPLVLEGTLAYRRPDRVEKHVQSPYDERITVEAGRLTMENRTHNRKKTLSVSGAPGLAALIESIRATRAGDLAALQRHYALQVEGSREQWTLTLKPLDAQVAAYVSQLTLTGSEARITRIVVEEAGGDRSVMEIEEQGK